MRLQISPFRSTTTRPNKSLFNQYQFFFNKITIGHLLESIASQASSRLCPQMYGKNNVAKARTSIFPTDNRYALAELCEPGETANLEPAEKTKHVRYRDIQCPSFFVWDSGWSSWWFIYIMYVYIYAITMYKHKVKRLSTSVLKKKPRNQHWQKVRKVDPRGAC